MEFQEAESDWMDPPTCKRNYLPVTDEAYIKNVRANCLLELPNLTTQKEHDKIMVMVCGGPSAKRYLEEIRQKRQDDRYVVFCSNKTHDWLISEGIIPHYQFIIDPKKSKLEDCEHPHKDVKYLVGVGCDHGVFKALEGYDVTRVFCVSGIGKPNDVEIINALFPYEEKTWLFGGTMAGLRAMSLADIMGFLTVEYYGFDSCYFDTDKDGVPVYYSYDKPRKENIQEAMTDDGRVFMTSPVFASQAQQYIKWKHRYEWIKFIIHGDSLTRAIDEIDNEKCKPKHNLLITDYHKKLNQALHNMPIYKESSDTDKLDLFGQSGHQHAGHVSVLIGLLIKRFNQDVTMLDYGCGKSTLEDFLPPIQGLSIMKYDPCIEGLDKAPEPADLVVCTDVLEHIEPDCLENVLDDLKRVTKKIALVSVATVAAEKSYSDGQNCHLIVEDCDWWRPKLKKRFFILESHVENGKKFTCVLQAKELR